MKTTLAVVALIAVACSGCQQREVFTVGAGSYTDELAGFDPKDTGPTFTVQVTNDAPYPYPTSDWWTSVLTNSYSRNLFAIPLAFRCDEQGLLVDRPGLLVTRDAIYSPFKPDFRIGLKDVKHDRALAAGWGDFTVDIRFPDKEASWTATIGHGLPFAYATFTAAGHPRSRFCQPPKLSGGLPMVF